MEEILKDLHEWETLLHIKDSAHAVKSIWSARQTQSSYSQNNFNSSNSTINNNFIAPAVCYDSKF